MFNHSTVGISRLQVMYLDKRIEYSLIQALAHTVFFGSSVMLPWLAEGGLSCNSPLSPFDWDTPDEVSQDLSLLCIPIDWDKEWLQNSACSSRPTVARTTSRPILALCFLLSEVSGQGNANSFLLSCIRNRHCPGADVGHLLAVSCPAGDGCTCGRHYSCFQL